MSMDGAPTPWLAISPGSRSIAGHDRPFKPIEQFYLAPSGSRQDLSNLAGPSRPDERAESARCSRWLTTRRMGEDARGCVKTCTSEERVALFSLLSFPHSGRQFFIFQ